MSDVNGVFNCLGKSKLSVNFHYWNNTYFINLFRLCIIITGGDTQLDTIHATSFNYWALVNIYTLYSDSLRRNNIHIEIGRFNLIQIIFLMHWCLMHHVPRESSWTKNTANFFATALTTKQHKTKREIMVERLFPLTGDMVRMNCLALIVMIVTNYPKVAS